MIYLDNNASTAVLPEVLAVMQPFAAEQYGNPSSSHGFGLGVQRALIEARAQVGKLLGASDPELEILLTSGGTESINTSFGSALQTQPQKKHIVTTAVEHSSVRETARHYQKLGYQLTEIGVDEQGRLNMAELKQTLSSDTALLAIMHANNETGVIFPVAEATKLAQQVGAQVLIDAVQSAGKLAIDVNAWQADFVALSAHKFHGPKGVGALYIKKDLPFVPLIIGGTQQQGRRAGTEGVADIVGMGVAARIVYEKLSEQSRVETLRNQFEEMLLKNISNVLVNGRSAPRLPNTSSLSFKDIDNRTLLSWLDRHGICASAGAACGPESRSVSHVMQAMKVPEAYQWGTIRISLSSLTTAGELQEAFALLSEAVTQLRAEPVIQN